MARQDWATYFWPVLQRAESSVALTGVEASRAFFSSCFDHSPARDRLWVAHLDEAARCIHLAKYDLPTDRPTGLPAIEILSDAVELDSAGVILARREEGEGDAPAREDAATTRAFAQAAEAVDVAVVDHLLFSDRSCTSFRRLGLL